MVITFLSKTPRLFLDGMTMSDYFSFLLSLVSIIFCAKQKDDFFQWVKRDNPSKQKLCTVWNGEVKQDKNEKVVQRMAVFLLSLPISTCSLKAHEGVEPHSLVLPRVFSKHKAKETWFLLFLS